MRMDERIVPVLLQRIAKAKKRDPVTLLKVTLEDQPTYREAAEALGVSEPTLYRWMRQLEVTRGG